MESDVKRIMGERLLTRISFSIPWMVGPIIYAFGLLLSTTTGNLIRFLMDYPWACLVAVITIAIWAIPRLAERHGRCTISIRKALNVTDGEFKALLDSNMRRLISGKNIVFGLTFLPALLWAFTQRLWWREYSQPVLFDAFYIVILVFILGYYASTMFGAAVSCNQNVYAICEKTPINLEYLLDEGQPILRRLWGGQILRITTVALVMSALTNVPILLYSGGASLLVNLAIALTLTALIFVAPHYMFHRMLERAKDERLAEVSERRRELRSEGPPGKGDARSVDDVGRMLDVIYLTQYEGVLANRNTWLVDLEVVVELLVVGSLHVIFMEILNIIAHR